MIQIDNHEFRTLSQPIYLGDGRRVCRVFANGEQVYPEIGNPNIIKIRGRRTIHASHSHDGLLANALYGSGRANRNLWNEISKQIYGENEYGVYDNYFAGGPVSFDITVSFSAVLRTHYNNMFSPRTDGTNTTTDFTHYGTHLEPIDFSFGSWWVGNVIKYYKETGSWDTPGTAYNYSPVRTQNYQKMCCPLCGTEPVVCQNYIQTPVVNGSFTNDSFIDADILVSIQMSTPQACSPIAAGQIWKSGGLGYIEVWGKGHQDKLSFPEFSANNGIHRVHAIVNCNPDNVSNGYPNSSQRFIKSEGFRPHYSSQPAIGNGSVTCGFPSFSYTYKSGSRKYSYAHIRYLRLVGIAPDINLSFEFPDWGAEYNYTENLQSNHLGDFNGIILCEVPIDEFLYVGKYDNAPDEHKEPQLSEL